MTLKDLQEIQHFAEINGLMHRDFTDVVNEYETTKELAETYEAIGCPPIIDEDEPETRIFTNKDY